jgi:hypothetical protein
LTALCARDIELAAIIAVNKSALRNEVVLDFMIVSSVKDQ